jgi:hypothetical protein
VLLDGLLRRAISWGIEEAVVAHEVRADDGDVGCGVAARAQVRAGRQRSHQAVGSARDEELAQEAQLAEPRLGDEELVDDALLNHALLSCSEGCVC